MKFLTKDIIKRIPKLYSTENVPVEEKRAVAKFFTPDSNWTWYVVEGEKEDDDWVFFGLVDGHEKEWGYFRLSELMEIRGQLGLPIERDMYFDGNIPL